MNVCRLAKQNNKVIVVHRRYISIYSFHLSFSKPNLTAKMAHVLKYKFGWQAESKSVTSLFYTIHTHVLCTVHVRWIIMVTALEWIIVTDIDAFIGEYTFFLCNINNEIKTRQQVNHVYSISFAWHEEHACTRSNFWYL